MGKMYARPETKMGIHWPANASSSWFDPTAVRFRIRSGDEEGFFKAEAEVIGDFIFLVLRTRTNNLNVLNRERMPEYTLEVRARVKGVKRSGGRDPRTRVHVHVEDMNDNDPLFVRDHFKFEVGEDAQLHSTVGRVRADDADEGVNGEVYYSLVESSSSPYFAVDAVSGVISVTRPLSARDRPRHELTVIAQDRGPKSVFKSQVNSASVSVKVAQVRDKIYVS